MLRGGTFEVEHGGVRQWSRASSLDRADVSLQREGRRQEEDEALRRACPPSNTQTHLPQDLVEIITIISFL